MLDPDPELTAEREHLTASHSALARMRERTTALFATGENVAGDAYTAETLGRTLARRLAELADNPDTPLFFGRLDHGPDSEERENATYHIGRRHVTDDAGEPMVLDWRAPISEAFYQASAADPHGVARRRRFGFDRGELTSFEDERLAAGEELGTASRILTEEIERPRVGPMRDIVATIQPEQDELVRAALADSICVQGAPGTGKTAVGLHRAAYLLYTYGGQLRRSRVLVVGPSRAFLDYIGAVLPALGEIDIDQLTIDELVAHVPVRAVDTDEAARVKHDVRMAEVIRRARDSFGDVPDEELVVPDGGIRWRVPTHTLRRLVDEVRDAVAGGLPYQTGRDRLTARLTALLQRMAEARGESPGEAWQRRMARSRPVRGFLDTAWPELKPEALVARLLSDPGFLATAADGVLTPGEQAAIRWPKPPRSPKSAPFSAADTVLVDEAYGLTERLTSYGHVVLDEAQDLSPMQCRAIARRTGHGSLTVLGDLAQGTAPWAAADWRDSLHHLGKPDAELTALTTGFRVPAAVVELANRLLPALGVKVPEAVSLRHDGHLTVRAADGLPAVVREALGHEGSVAVIAADAAVPALREALPSDQRLTVLPATLAKGLEYDHVIVVEPAAIVAAEPRGLHRLYVVLTRAVSRLDVLHTEPLPEPLAS